MIAEEGAHCFVEAVGSFDVDEMAGALDDDGESGGSSLRVDRMIDL